MIRSFSSTAIRDLFQMTPSWLAAAGNRALLSLTTVPSLGGWIAVAGITIASTAAAGLLATASGFVDPIGDYDPPWRRSGDDDGSFRHKLHWSIKPLSAFIFPSLAEEVLWRGTLIAPHPSTVEVNVYPSQLMISAFVVLMIHVLVHPLAGYTCWPRGRKVFCDWRFLLSANIVLGGATVSYLVSGGSVWAAALTHGLPVLLWRDFFGGEALLMRSTIEADDSGEKS